MIISRTPYRISFFGGGTDYPGWYEENGGQVLSTSFNKFSYISCKKIPNVFEYKYRLRYFKTEQTKLLNEIDHPSFRETLKFLKIDNPIELVHFGDLPAGTGLGSSSAFTVGLLNTLYALNNKMVTKRTLAMDAINIEQNILKEDVGSQDQVCCSFGGLNKIKFGGMNKFTLEPLLINSDNFHNLENHLGLFFTGFTRNSNIIAKKQINNIKKNSSNLIELDKQVNIAEGLLFDNNIKDFGRLLGEQWEIKKTLAKDVSNPIINDIYKKGIQSGAYGGKLLGAGSGGFILFVIKPSLKSSLVKALDKYVHIPIKLENIGSQIVYFTN